MSVIIVFPDGTDWFKANWVFRQLALDICKRYSSDAEVCEAMAVAEALGSLNLKKMTEGLRTRVMGALSTVARETIQGVVAGWRQHDAKEHTLYREAISELAEHFEGQSDIDRSSPRE